MTWAGEGIVIVVGFLCWWLGREQGRHNRR